MQNEEIQQLKDHIDFLFTKDRDYPKDKTFSEIVSDLKTKNEEAHTALLDMIRDIQNDLKNTKEISELKLNQILEQTTKHNGRMAKVETKVEKLEVDFIRDSSVLKGKITVFIAVVAFLASIVGPIIVSLITNHL